MSSPARLPSAGAEPAAYPLSAVQEGMLFDSLRDDCSARGIEVLVLELHGTLDAQRLETAWQRVSARHDALRTSFSLTADRPLQHVRGFADLPFTVEDVELGGPDERDWYVRACVRTERRRGFALDEPPLQRVRLIRFGENAQVLIWTNHHAIMDGRSRRIVLREIVDAYSNLTPLRPATPYRRHIAWLEEQRFAASDAFWRERLRGFAAPTALPAAFGALPESAGTGLPESIERTLTGNDARRVLDFARTQDLTVGVLVQAAWSLVLARHAATADVVFGTVRAGRHASAGGDAVGLLIATPPLRVNVDERAPLVPWLREVRARWNELRDHEHVPLRSIAACSEIPAPQRLFETLVVYERETFMHAVADDVDPEGLLGIQRASLYENTGFPLSLHAAGTTELQLRLQYDTARFGLSDAARLIDEVVTIVCGFPEHAGGSVADVPSLTPAESARLITQWNRVTPYPHQASTHELFHVQALRTPAAIALQLGTATMTYRELDRQSGTVAAQLRARGIGRGDFVALHAERSFEMVAGLLGILKAGAAVIPLDIHYPPDRLATVLRDGAVRIMLAQAPLSGELRPVLELLAPDAPEMLDIAALAGASCSPFHAAHTGALDPAHVMYTSGSTGAPKCAVIPHQAIVRTVCGTDYLRFAADETFFAFVPLTFDVAILEIWGPLLHGARLVLCPPGLPSLDVLASTIEAQGVTTLWLTTALFEQVVEEELEHLGGLRQLIVGGDVMSPAHARRIMNAFPALAARQRLRSDRSDRPDHRTPARVAAHLTHSARGADP